jgi:hypothetical protein
VDRTTLEGCAAKLDRADEAIKAANEELSAWLTSNPYPTRVEVDHDKGEHRLFFDFSVPLPSRFPVLLGEVVHDLRSTLDHLVWREAVEHLGSEKAEKNAPKITFPIHRSRVEFKDSKVKRFVNPNAWAIIERHQPYDRGKPARSKALELLHWMNRIDKHRLLHGTSMFVGWFDPLKLIEWNRDARLIAAPSRTLPHVLKREVEVACFRFDPAGPEPNVRAKAPPPLNVFWGGFPRRVAAVGINKAAAEVREIVAEFGDLLP